MPESHTETTTPDGLCFTFGDPEPALNQNLIDYSYCWIENGAIEPPVSFDGLMSTLESNVHHASAIELKANHLTRHFVPNRFLTRSDFVRLVTDFFIFGNLSAALETSALGNTLRVHPLLQRLTRVRAEGGLVQRRRQGAGQDYEVPPERACHIKRYDPQQTIYGRPTYLAALQSIWLHESAVIFRRRYYTNAGHTGYFLYIADPSLGQENAKKIQQALENSKGPGNFKNLFLYSPGGQADAVKLMPVQHVNAKDEFANISSSGAENILTMHRVPPVLMGVIPKNAAGHGSIADADAAFHYSEIRPVMTLLEELNDLARCVCVAFTDYQPIRQASSLN